jgi:Flp pilus assembly pilin Flp
MASFACRFWIDEEGQDIAEYAVMLAVILVIVVGTLRMIGFNANTVFSNVGFLEILFPKRSPPTGNLSRKQASDAPCKRETVSRTTYGFNLGESAATLRILLSIDAAAYQTSLHYEHSGGTYLARQFHNPAEETCLSVIGAVIKSLWRRLTYSLNGGSARRC